MNEIRQIIQLICMQKYTKSNDLKAEVGLFKLVLKFGFNHYQDFWFYVFAFISVSKKSVSPCLDSRCVSTSASPWTGRVSAECCC